MPASAGFGVCIWVLPRCFLFQGSGWYRVRRRFKRQCFNSANCNQVHKLTRASLNCSQCRDEPLGLLPCLLRVSCARPSICAERELANQPIPVVWHSADQICSRVRKLFATQKQSRKECMAETTLSNHFLARDRGKIIALTSALVSRASDPFSLCQKHHSCAH